MSLLAKSTAAVLVMIRSKFVPICNSSHVRRYVNSGKITISSLTPYFQQNPRSRRHEILSRETIVWWKPETSISTELEMVARRDKQTDGQTDRITIANTR